MMLGRRKENIFKRPGNKLKFILGKCVGFSRENFLKGLEKGSYENIFMFLHKIQLITDNSQLKSHISWMLEKYSGNSLKMC